MVIEDYNNVVKTSDYITKNFQLREFKVSASFPELASKIKFTNQDLMVIEILCLRVLQPVRDKFGALKILSGKRNELLNEKVKGSPTSDHLTANACDFTPISGVTTDLVFDWIVEDSGIDFRQIIYYTDENFIHVSCNVPFKTRRNDRFVKENGVLTKI